MDLPGQPSAVCYAAQPEGSPVAARADHERRPSPGRRHGALVGAKNGVHEMRDHWRRREAELAGESEAMKRPSASKPSPPASKPHRWDIYHIKGTPAVL